MTDSIQRFPAEYCIASINDKRYSLQQSVALMPWLISVYTPKMTLEKLKSNEFFSLVTIVKGRVALFG